MKTQRLNRRPLKLTNDGRLDIFFIGCGSAFARSNYQNNILLIKGDDHLLIDCGTRTPLAFDQLGLALSDIQNILITHCHADHVGGFEELALSHRYLSQTKPDLYIEKEFAPILWNWSLRGGLACNEQIKGANLTLADYCAIHHPESASSRLPRKGSHFRIGDIDLKTFRTCHFPQQAATWETSFYSIGFIIDDRVLFTGDTKYDPELITSMCKEYAIEAIFHDVQFFVGGIHAGLDEISNLPPEIRAKTFLMHYPDNWRKHLRRIVANDFRLVREWHHYYL